jgi:hypothetical protein
MSQAYPLLWLVSENLDLRHQLFTGRDVANLHAHDNSLAPAPG